MTSGSKDLTLSPHNNSTQRNSTINEGVEEPIVYDLQSDPDKLHVSSNTNGIHKAHAIKIQPTALDFAEITDVLVSNLDIKLKDEN